MTSLPLSLRFSLVMLAAAVVLAVNVAHGRFIRPDVEKIPVARLIDNLESQTRANPKDVTLRFNLARAHAMAFALKTDTVEVNKNIKTLGPWFGYTPKAVPFEVKKGMDAKQNAEAKAHLAKALARYEEVIKMSTKSPHLAAQLGHAWLVDKSGQPMKAIDEYRKVIDKAWAVEGKRKFGGLGGNYITAEAAGYLIPLLDAKKDTAEIKTLEERIAHLKKLPRPITPIAIPLRDNLSVKDILDPTAKVRFDADGTGLDRSWNWIRPDAGWLVHDPKASGKITSALQMFGSVSFLMFWDNGYQAMRALDDNGDGFLSGAELDSLAIWHDVNRNGISDPGEVKSLRAWGIVKLSCQHLASTSPDCAAFAPAGVWFENGTVRPTYDVILRSW